jgi:hypothetical protein
MFVSVDLKSCMVSFAGCWKYKNIELLQLSLSFSIWFIPNTGLRKSLAFVTVYSIWFIPNTGLRKSLAFVTVYMCKIITSHRFNLIYKSATSAEIQSNCAESV